MLRRALQRGLVAGLGRVGGSGGALGAVQTRHLNIHEYQARRRSGWRR